MSELTIREIEDCPYCMDGGDALAEDSPSTTAFIDNNGRLDVYGHGAKPILSMQAKYCPMCGRQFDMRPMTMDEAENYHRPLYREVHPAYSGMASGWIVSADKPLWRFWPDKPTPEQSAAWPWEEVYRGKNGQ